MNEYNTKLLVNISLISCLFPYVGIPGFILLNNDIQPIMYICVCTLFIIGNFTNHIKYNFVDILFLTLALYYFIFFDPLLYGVLPKQSALILSFVVYIVFKNYSSYVSPFILFWIFVVNILLCLMQLISADAFLLVFENFLRTIKQVQNSGRGVSGVTPEPSFIAGIFYVIFLLFIHFYHLNKVNKNLLINVSVILILFIVFNKTGTALMIVLWFIITIFLFYGNFNTKLKYFFAVSLLSIILIYFIGGNENRFAFFLSKLFLDPMAVFLDHSMYGRFMSFYLGVHTLFHQYFLFGQGPGSAKLYSLDYIGEYLELTRLFSDETKNGDLAGSNLSAIGMLLFELGMVGVIFGIILIKDGAKSFKTIFIRFSAFILLVSSFPITFPGFWIIMGMTYNQSYKIKK